MYCYIWGNKMKKRRKNSESVNKKFNLVDIIVIISSIPAVIVLGGLLVYSKKNGDKQTTAAAEYKMKMGLQQAVIYQTDNFWSLL